MYKCTNHEANRSKKQHFSSFFNALRRCIKLIEKCKLHLTTRFPAALEPLVVCDFLYQVYRSVLISGKKKRLSGSSVGNTQSSPTDNSQKQGSGDSSPVPMCSTSTLPASQPGSIPSTPTLAPSTSSSLPPSQEQDKEEGVVGEEERGDLIHFYNRVYIKQMRHFALRYSPSSPSAGVQSPPLCPYPSLRTSSPRRVLLSHNHSIYISPHKTTGSPPTPSTTARDKIFYYICSSPSNRLAEINSMIRTGETPSKKRSMQLEEEPSPKRVCPDNQTALLRRLQDVANDLELLYTSFYALICYVCVKSVRYLCYFFNLRYVSKQL
ncbi:unnamed protein product [Oncorhynchus mykiss]|uniref:Retinoblastoma-associated protein C-terminal domain-containing protein n=1 Tax=Oncorhynchus mykiss TaxID=8022 RepID=A0A060W059_ONCMY|nr:unnamed protein product [Oncorhynchus mykiss]